MSNPYEPPSSPSNDSRIVLPLSRRILLRTFVAIAVLSAFVILAYPKGNQFNADSNLLPGPLWLISQARAPTEQHLIGFAIAIPSLAAVASVIIWPRWYTALAASIGVGFWFGVAVWVAMITAA